MKNALDLVKEAKAHTQEVALNEVDTALTQADAVIDVREADEYASGHLPGAIHMSRGLLEFKLSAHPVLNNRNAKLVVYCKTSGRAALAAQQMQAMGYLHVVNIAGGYDAWVAAGKPTVKPDTPNFG